MRFALDADQVALVEAVQDLLAKECPPAVVRAAAEAPPGQLDRGLWRALAGMGVLSVLVAEADGGLGLDEVTLVPLLEACGAAAVPYPVTETAMVAAPLLGGELGDRMVAASLDGSDLVPYGPDADLVLLPQKSFKDVWCLAGALFDPENGNEVDRARRLGRAPAELGAATVVTDDPDQVALAFDRGALGTAAELVGLAQRMLDLAVAHAKDRHQFGVPIGSFQAVKHHLADAHTAVAFARPAVLRAAWSTARGEPTRARDVSMAKAMASDAAALAGRKALQCHGAIGYTVEYDLHLYLKRAWALARRWGDAAWHRDRVAAALEL